MALYIASCINDKISYIRSFYTCHHEQMTPSPIDYTFVDFALSNVSIKDNSDQPSQTSYEDEASESVGLVSATTSTPKPTSLSSKTSCSSGYHSGGSYVDESVSLKSIQPSFPESTGEVLSNKDIYEDFPPSSIAISPIQETHKTRNGELVLSSIDVSENISMDTEGELTSITSNYKTQSKQSLNSHKKNTSNTRTLQIDSSVHKSIFAKPKSNHSSALPDLSTGQESTLTMQNWLVFSYNCIAVYI